MDFEWHLIRFCHGAVVHKQVARPSEVKRSGEVGGEVRRRQNHPLKLCFLPNSSLKVLIKVLTIG